MKKKYKYVSVELRDKLRGYRRYSVLVNSFDEDPEIVLHDFSTYDTPHPARTAHQYAAVVDKALQDLIG